jgi:hypothetical protein
LNVRRALCLRRIWQAALTVIFTSYVCRQATADIALINFLPLLAWQHPEQMRPGS